jgi:acetyltransferase
VHYRENQNLLMQVPASVGDGDPDREARAPRVVREALAEGPLPAVRPDTKAILAAYGIPVVPTRAAPRRRTRCAPRARSAIRWR